MSRIIDLKKGAVIDAHSRKLNERSIFFYFLYARGQARKHNHSWDLTFIFTDETKEIADA